jgi:hypothetical protein
MSITALELLTALKEAIEKQPDVADNNVILWVYDGDDSTAVDVELMLSQDDDGNSTPIMGECFHISEAQYHA